MHIQTHILSGWCVANLIDLTPRERALGMAAAVAADLDGLGVFVSLDCYAQYHHVLGHNLVAALLISAVLTGFSTHRGRCFGLYLALFHLHLLLDYFGSGPGWPIRYWWPFAATQWESAYAWPLSSWQNSVAGLLFLSWTVAIGIRSRRTPLEAIVPAFDQKLFRNVARGDGSTNSGAPGN